jgi:spoIIIJ-associated protein
MESAEASGKTVEDALKRALATLGANRDEVEFVVLDEGQRGGLFGRGARDAVVRVERLAEPAEPAPDSELPDTRIPRGSTSSAPRSSGQGRRESRPPANRSRGRQDRPPRSSGGSSFDQPSPRLTEADFMKAPNYDDSAPPPPPPPRQGNGGGRRPPVSEAPRAQAPDRRRRRDEPEIAPDINAEEVDFAAQVVDDLLQILDISAEINIREPLTAGDGLGAVLAVIDISGDDLGLLIGRKGDTLVAMQYLVNLIVTRRYPGRGGVSIDVEHYKHRREEQIVSLARRMADRVRQTGAPITLEPMSAAERRIVHLVLADDPELATNSIGEGEHRKVVISARN